MNIVVGLGNPESRYDGTYHNIGFAVVDVLAKKLGITFDKQKYKALIGEGTLNGEKLMLVKPTTYMNLSGECLALLNNKFKDARILVVVDDIDLPKGNVRYREHGSAGTGFAASFLTSAKILKELKSALEEIFQWTWLIMCCQNMTNKFLNQFCRKLLTKFVRD